MAHAWTAWRERLSAQQHELKNDLPEDLHLPFCRERIRTVLCCVYSSSSAWNRADSEAAPPPPPPQLLTTYDIRPLSPC